MIDLDAIPFESTRYPGVWIHFYHRAETTRNAAVMIKMAPGASYPRHRHRGAEELLVLRGGFRDEHGEYRAGDYARYEDGSTHHPIALDEGADCIFFAVTAEGIELYGV